jgi:hypothetical protein
VGDLFGVINDATGSRPGGGEQTYTDDASYRANGYLSATRNVQVTSDLEVAAAIQWLVNTHKTPKPRLTGASVDAYTDPTENPGLRALDVDSRLDVTGMPTQNASSTLMLRVNGYKEHIDAGHWDIDPSTSSFAGVQGLILDDATFGKTDSDNVLVY